MHHEKLTISKVLTIQLIVNTLTSQNILESKRGNLIDSIIFPIWPRNQRQTLLMGDNLFSMIKRTNSDL